MPSVEVTARSAQIAPEHAKQGLGGRDLAVLQKIEHRGERSRLGLRVNGLAPVFVPYEVRLMLLLDLGQFGRQDLESVPSAHHSTHAVTSVASRCIISEVGARSWHENMSCRP